MATIQVIYQIASDITKLEQGVAKGVGSLQKMESGFSRIQSAAGMFASAMVGAFSISSVVAFGREIVNDADALMRMSDQTGVGVEALQRLRAIADDSGNSIDQLTAAISMMQNRVSGGDRNTVSALEGMGIALQDFVGLKPEEQFMAIAREVAKIPDPMERTRVAMVLFGRSGAQILPSLRADVDRLSDSTRVMSERSIANWDLLGDTVTRWARTIKAEIGNAVMGAHDVTRQDAINKLIAIEDGLRLPDLPKGPGSQPSPLTVPGLPSPDVIAATERELKKAVDRVQETERATREAARAAADLAREWEDMGPTMEQWIADLNEDAWQGPTLAMMDLGRELDKLENVRPGITAEDMREIGQATKDAALVWIQDYGPSIEQAGFQAQTFKGTMQGVLGDLNDIFTAAFSGGGGIGGAIKGLATNMTEGLLGMIPGIGPFLSQFSGAIIAGLSRLGGRIKGFFTNLFGGPSGDELAGRQIVSAFEDNLSQMLTETQRMEAGNDAWKQTVIAIRDQYIAMGLTEADALRDTERLWAASRDGAEAAKRVIEEIQTRFAQGITIPVTMPVTGLSGVRDPNEDLGIIPMAKGGSGRVTRPTLFLAGEAGPEDFSFHPVNRSSDGGGVIENNVYLDGDLLFRAMERFQSRDMRSRYRLRMA